MKSNDNIPQDEMLLAEALAAAKARRWGWKSGLVYDKTSIRNTSAPGRDTTACCAIGAVAVAVDPKLTARIGAYRVACYVFETRKISKDKDDLCFGVYSGNDDLHWLADRRDDGESLGWAFRCAMTQEEP